MGDDEYQLAAPEDETVVAYRLSRLLAAGYPPAVAAMIADLRTIDLHRALDLIDQGCDPDAAALILL